MHLDVVVAQLHAELMKPLDQPPPVCVADGLDAQRRYPSPPLPLLLPPGGADLGSFFKNVFIF